MITQTLLIPSSSKGQISAVVHRSEKQGDRLAILCPGYLDSKDYPHLVDLAQDLTGLGYTVVRFDPTGTWDSAEDIANYSMTQYLEDVRSLIDAFCAEHEYSEILLCGHSLGGAISLLHAARDSRVTSVIAVMSSLGRAADEKRLEEWREYGVAVSKRDLPDQNGTKIFSVPFSYQKDRERCDVLETVKNIHVPLFLIAGELDRVVPSEEAKKIYDVANQPKTFTTVSGIGHDYRHHKEEITVINSLIVEWLETIAAISTTH